MLWSWHSENNTSQKPPRGQRSICPCQNLHIPIKQFLWLELTKGKVSREILKIPQLESKSQCKYRVGKQILWQFVSVSELTTNSVIMKIKFALLLPMEWVYCVSSTELDCIQHFKVLFIYIWLHWVFVALHGLSLVVASGGYSPDAVHGLLIVVGFHWCRAQTLEHAGFRSCSLWALELRFGSWGIPASLPLSMWNLPRPRIEPTSTWTGRQIFNYWTTREVPWTGFRYTILS